MILTMSEFRDIMNKFLEKAEPSAEIELFEVLELRICRIESYLGMEIPDDLDRIRTKQGRKK